MFTAPPLPRNNSNARSALVRQANDEANVALQSRFPGWSFINGQYYPSGKPHKAHIKDHAGRTWTVWFNNNEHIVRVVAGNH